MDRFLIIKRDEMACQARGSKVRIIHYRVGQYRPQEFSDIQEIYRLRRSIMERLLRNADQLRRRLG